MQRDSQSEGAPNETAKRSDIGSALPDYCNLLHVEDAMAAGSLSAEPGTLGMKSEPSARSSEVDDPSAFKGNASKPTKNLSAYNFYFKDQRQKLLENLPIRPEGKPRRSHGKIGFSEMARTIAAGWKSIDADARSHYENLAKQDKERYTREMEDWKGMQGVHDRRKKSSGLHGMAQAKSSGNAWGRDIVVELRHGVNGSPTGAAAGALIGTAHTSSVVSLNVHSQHLHASVHASSQQAIEQLARPMRVAASLPNMKEFASALPPALDHLPATSSLPSFQASKARGPPRSNQVLLPSFMQCNASPSWGTPFEYVPGGLTLLRQAEGTREALNPYVIQRHPPPHPFPQPEVLPHDAFSPTESNKAPPTSPFHFTESSTPGISILANELENEGVEFLLDVFRRSNPDRHTSS